MMMLVVVGWFADWQRYLYCRHCSARRIVDLLPRKRWAAHYDDIVGPSAADDDDDGDNASSLLMAIIEKKH